MALLGSWKSGHEDALEPGASAGSDSSSAASDGIAPGTTDVSGDDCDGDFFATGTTAGLEGPPDGDSLDGKLFVLLWDWALGGCWGSSGADSGNTTADTPWDRPAPLMVNASTTAHTTMSVPSAPAKQIWAGSGHQSHCRSAAPLLV